MAETYTKAELIEIYRGLPEEVKDAIFSPETTDIFDAIKEKQHLTDEQREIMSVYTGFLMMGVLPPEKYVPTLITKMGIEREKVASIAQTINRDLFNPIKGILKELHAAQNNAPESKPGSTTNRAAAVAPEAQETAKEPAIALIKDMPETTVAPRATPMMMPPLEPTPVPAPTPITAPMPAENAPKPINIEAALQKDKENPVSSNNDLQGNITQPHIGSIFEQKLGGEFRLKSDAASYSNQKSEESAGKTTTAPGA